MHSQVTDTCVLLGTEGCSHSYACVLGAVVNPVVETASCLPYPVFVPFFLANRTWAMGVAEKLHFLDSFADGSDQRYIWKLLNQPFPPSSSSPTCCLENRYRGYHFERENKGWGNSEHQLKVCKECPSLCP